MIAVTVRNEKRPDAVKLQPVIQGMEIIIRRQIQQQIIVDQRLGTGPDVFPAELTGLPAQLTVTEHPRPCFPGSGTIISDLHLFILPYFLRQRCSGCRKAGPGTSAAPAAHRLSADATDLSAGSFFRAARWSAVRNFRCDPSAAGTVCRFPLRYSPPPGRRGSPAAVRSFQYRAAAGFPPVQRHRS